MIADIVRHRTPHMYSHANQNLTNPKHAINNCLTVKQQLNKINKTTSKAVAI